MLVLAMSWSRPGRAAKTDFHRLLYTLQYPYCREQYRIFRNFRYGFNSAKVRGGANGRRGPQPPSGSYWPVERVRASPVLISEKPGPIGCPARPPAVPVIPVTA
jgi:hypothetical protein